MKNFRLEWIWRIVHTKRFLKICLDRKNLPGRDFNLFMEDRSLRRRRKKEGKKKNRET